LTASSDGTAGENDEQIAVAAEVAAAGIGTGFTSFTQEDSSIVSFSSE